MHLKKLLQLRLNQQSLITFFASGLWHGADWTFVIWGGVHGVAQVIENIACSKKYGRSSGFFGLIRMVLVFMFCLFTWVFFVSTSVDDAFYVFSQMFNGIGRPIAYLYRGFFSMGLGKIELVFSGISLVILLIYDYIGLNNDVISLITSKKTVVRWMIYSLLILWIIMKIPLPEATTEFIYFQF